MAAKSKIEWTDATWNPVTGCTKISEGCANCYAEKMAKRLQAAGSLRYRNGFDVTCHPDVLDEPLHWKKPRRIFVCSMSDLFHEDVPNEFIWPLFDTMNGCDRHTYIVLTKRPQRMKAFIDMEIREFGWGAIPEHIWLGVTAENQRCADERIPILLQIPVAVRFVSLEPMLGPIEFSAGKLGYWEYACGHIRDFTSEYAEWHLETGAHICPDCDEEEAIFHKHIHWVIVGAESGPKRRECKLEWVRDVVNQCKTAGVPVFVKQLHIDEKLSKNMAEWPPDLRVRQWPRGGNDEGLSSNNAIF